MTWRRVLAALVATVGVAAVVGLVLVSTRSAPTPPPSPTPLPPPAAPPPAAAPSPVRPPGPPCVAPGTRERDVDRTDPPDVPWPRRNGQPIEVHFETADLPRRYANAVVLAARIWSQSPCARAVAVARCPPRAQCTTIAAKRSGGGEDVDGDSESERRRGVRVGNAITLYTGLLDESTDNGALGTVVHEMGHALGLRHRVNPRSIMSATTSESTDPRPDAVDFGNLAVLYGDRSGAPR